MVRIFLQKCIPTFSSSLAMNGRDHFSSIEWHYQRWEWTGYAWAGIYGPRKYGGSEHTNMAMEQIAQHTHLMIGSNMQPNDLTVDSYQIYLGTEQQFLEQNPADFQYRLNLTKSPITYIWEKLWTMKGKITPTPTRENYCTIINHIRDRIKELQGTPGSYSKRQYGTSMPASYTWRWQC